MNKSPKENKHKIGSKEKSMRIHAFLAIGFTMITCFVIEMAVLIRINEKNADKSMSLILDQVVSLLEENSQNAEITMENELDSYMATAKSVAYIVDANPEMTNDLQEMELVAEYTGVDEIMVLDENGIVYLSTDQSMLEKSISDDEELECFRPMLSDKKLEMSQNIDFDSATDDTIYAASWDDKGERIIVVGISADRMYEALAHNEMQKVISDIPSYEGFDIYVVNPENGKILAGTDSTTIGITLDSIGIPPKDMDFSVAQGDKLTIDGYRQYIRSVEFENWIVLVKYNTKNNLESFLLIAGLAIAALGISGGGVLVALNRLITANSQRDAQLAILVSMSEIYYNMHLIDLRENSFVEYRANQIIKDLADDKKDASGTITKVIEARTSENFKEKMVKFVDLKTLPDRLKGKKVISKEYIAVSDKWYEASFVSIEEDNEGNPIKVIFTNRDIDDAKLREERLIIKSNTDELTGFYNRRAYEEDVAKYESAAIDDDFIYVSLDVNGLKVTNDTLGHAAGDELIVGACECMSNCFGPYGKLYRTGGDEFAAIIFADERKFDEIKKEFDEMVADWSGKLIETLAVSYGYVLYSQSEEKDIRRIAVVADKRMYESKSAYYRRKGFDRRGQRDAHIALCALYTKILKVNITEDTYQIINMDAEEQTPDKGFSDKISVWLSDFAKTGQVHPDDLESYLSQTNLMYMRDYFTRKKKPIHIFYRRKIGNDYKQVMMEIIPANDYSDEDQNLYLYVKDIDK